MALASKTGKKRRDRKTAGATAEEVVLGEWETAFALPIMVLSEGISRIEGISVQSARNKLYRAIDAGLVPTVRDAQGNHRVALPHARRVIRGVIW